MATTECPPLADRITKSLLGYGVIAGPLYVLTAFGQAVFRDGYDPSRHTVSQFANGDWGWIQIASFLVTGAMTIAAAVGIGRALKPGRRASWAAVLIGVYGAALIVAGIFPADPADGFPPGTPEGAGSVSGHGLAHFAAAGVGFACLIAAAFVIAGWLSDRGSVRWAWFSRIVAGFFGAAFVATASGAHGALTMYAFTVAVIVMWGWLSALSVKVYGMVGRPT
ncbi:DUF998 domain-containing protein [Mycobacterium sp. NPDC050041]|uniref:DUF998 domain-containing protein n=1 Tax=Mycobacterium sp. NPDC050041 TaxID=3364293 RepID=UPI003C2DC5BA